MFLALRELKFAKRRFAMIGIILVLIAWLVFILSGLGNGLANLSAATFKNMEVDYVTYEEGARESMNRSLLSEDLVEDLESEENVEAATVMGSHIAVVLEEGGDSDDEKMDVSLLDVEPGAFLEPEASKEMPWQQVKMTVSSSTAPCKMTASKSRTFLKSKGPLKHSKWQVLSRTNPSTTCLRYS